MWYCVLLVHGSESLMMPTRLVALTGDVNHPCLVKWCLLGFSTVKFSFFPLSLVNILGESPGDYENHVSPATFAY